LWKTNVDVFIFLKESAMETATKKEQQGYVNCLGWCGKKFLSPDRARIRFCKRCAAKKEQAERNLSKIRSFGDGLSTPHFDE
jgi:hypothetical protein